MVGKKALRLIGGKNGWVMAGTGLTLAALAVVAGCQTYVPGVSLPSSNYLEHPPAYSAPTPPFPASREMTKLQEAGGLAPAAPSLPLQPTAGKGEQASPAIGTLTTRAGSSQVAGSKSILVNGSELEDFALKTERMTFNNFSLSEHPGYCVGSPSLIQLRVQGCYRNRMANPVTYTLVLVGLDAGGDVLWSGTLSGLAAAKDVGCLQEQLVAVHAGTLKQTASVRFRANVVPSSSQPCPSSPISPVTSAAPTPCVQSGFSRQVP